MIVVSYLDNLTPLVNSNGPDSGAGNNKIKEVYCFIKVLESIKSKNRSNGDSFIFLMLQEVSV